MSRFSFNEVLLYRLTGIDRVLVLAYCPSPSPTGSHRTYKNTNVPESSPVRSATCSTPPINLWGPKPSLHFWDHKFVISG
ncbi:hypothetical protein WA026_022179 [Henosepilachna vigintioctopunctata]|uniref:Uncharacterized protein n=1 Tax=Henosepilachna vigintioctopunctata TaxID=420089 RepID=A0AAW1TSQ4_9CUCU